MRRRHLWTFKEKLYHGEILTFLEEILPVDFPNELAVPDKTQFALVSVTALVSWMSRRHMRLLRLVLDLVTGLLKFLVLAGSCLWAYRNLASFFQPGQTQRHRDRHTRLDQRAWTGMVRRKYPLA